MIPVSFSFSLSFSFLCYVMICYVIYFVTIKQLTKIILLLFYFIFFIEITLIFSCSGMFRNVPYAGSVIDAREEREDLGEGTSRKSPF